jgi:hypothetical protein
VRDMARRLCENVQEEEVEEGGEEEGPASRRLLRSPPPSGQYRLTLLSADDGVGCDSGGSNAVCNGGDGCRTTCAHSASCASDNL